MVVAALVPGQPITGNGLGVRTCAVADAGHCRLTGRSTCAVGASMVRAGCWLPSEGEARRLPPRPPPLDRRLGQAGLHPTNPTPGVVRQEYFETGFPAVQLDPQVDKSWREVWSQFKARL